MKLYQEILSFIHIAENIKNELRHSWTSKERRESVADHSWRMSLMVILCHQVFVQKFELEKALIMAIIHDLGEAVIGDEHYFDVNKNKESRDKRLISEREAVCKLTSSIGEPGQVLLKFWEEFANQTTFEAKLINALDKLEVCIQHNEADISSWSSDEINGIFSYLNQIESLDELIIFLKEKTKEETMLKLNGKSCL